MNLSTYGANAILDGTAMPATLYLELHTGNPTAAGTANSAGLDRKSFTRAAAAAGASSNVAELLWSAPPAATVSHATVWDALSGGNCWWVGALDAIQVFDGVLDFVIVAGDLDLSFGVWS